MFSKIKNYVADQVTLVKLEGVERVGRAVAAVAFMLIALVFALFFFTFLCFAGAYYLSVYLDSYTYGFLAMAGVFFLLLIIFLIFKKGIQNLVVNIVIAATMGDKKAK